MRTRSLKQDQTAQRMGKTSLIFRRERVASRLIPFCSQLLLVASGFARMPWDGGHP